MERVFIYILSGFVAAVILYVLIQGLPSSPILTDPQTLLREADSFYKTGETAKTVDERQMAFNHSLTLYTNLEKTYHPDYGSGNLYYNIANTYFQLNEIPLAIYYYHRAAGLAPRDPAIQYNLALALQKLHLTVELPNPLSLKTLTLASIFSLPQRLNLFFWTIVACFVLASLYIWRRFTWLKPLIGLFIVLVFLQLCMLFYTRYLASQEGVLVQPTTLYRDAGLQYAKVTSEPLQAGLKVEVISIQETGAWLKILSPDGSLGYVPSDAIKLL